MAPKNSISNQNPDKKENLARQKYPENQTFEIPLKSESKPVTCPLSQSFSDKKVTPVCALIT